MAMGLPMRRLERLAVQRLYRQGRDRDRLSLTMISAERHLRQVGAKHAQKDRSQAVSFGRFTDRSRTWSWWRRAMTSI